MLRILASVGTLLFGASIMMLGGSLLGIILPLAMHGAGMSTGTAGTIMAAYFGGLLAGSFYAKGIITRVGHIRAFAGFAAIIVVLILTHPMAFNGAVWAVLRFVHGFCGAGVFTTLESWLNERSDNANRGRVLGVYMVVSYTVTILGQLMVNLPGLEGMQGFIVAALLTSLSLVPIVLTRVEAPDLSKLEPLGFRELYRASPLAVVGAGASGMMMGSYFSLGALFASDIGLNVFGVSLFTGSVLFGGLVLQFPIGRLSDRYDRRSVLLAVLTVVISVCALGAATSIPGTNIVGLIGLGAILGGTASSVYPIVTAQAFDHLPRARYVGATSGLLLAYAMGASFGPVVCGQVMAALGPFAFFGFIGFVATGFAGFVVYRMVRRAPVPVERQEAVVILPRTSAAVAELDPRTEPAERASAPRTAN